MALLVLSALSGCETFSTSVRDKEPFDPLPVYSTWWVATEACSARSGDYTAIEWFTATWIVGDHRVAWGRWSPPHEITIVRGYEEDEPTVRHEMLHDLLAGDPGHQDPDWDACGLTVGH